MAKLCECCGNKNNSFVGDPLYLPDDKILCYKCAKPIRAEFNNLFYKRDKKEFISLANSIIGKSKILFNDDITNHICILINRHGHKMGVSISANEKAALAKADKTEYHIDTNSTGMFSNIGSKIKKLAEITTWIGIISFVVGGFCLMMIDEAFMLTGILVAIFGSLASWVSSFVLYGFGQLIENTDKLVEQTKNKPQS